MTDREIDDLFEDEADGSPDADAREKRINSFLQQVDKKIKIAKARNKVDAKTRLAAVRWLGEAGEPTAIPTLVALYKKDDTRGMKEAAAYALGQFRALETAMEDPELAEYAQELISDIIFEGRMGKKARPSAGTLRVITGILFVSLLVWGGLLFVLSDRTPSPTVATQPTEIPEVITPDIDIEADLARLYQELETDAETLRVQFLNITRDQSPDCTVTFNAPQPYEMPVGLALDSDLGTLVTELEAIRAEVDPLRNAYINACEALRVIPAPQALIYSDNIAEAQRQLSDLSARIAFDSLSVVEDDTEQQPTPEPDETTIIQVPEETPEPAVDEVDTVNYDSHIASLQFNIETMNNFRGHNTLLLQYWQDVRASGSTGGCLNLPPPTLPLDYELPEELVDGAPEELLNAIEAYNLGMTLSRSSWQAFANACRDNMLSDVVTIQNITTQTAQDAFDDAQAQLTDLVFGRR